MKIKSEEETFPRLRQTGESVSSFLTHADLASRSQRGEQGAFRTFATEGSEPYQFWGNLNGPQRSFKPISSINLLVFDPSEETSMDLNATSNVEVLKTYRCFTDLGQSQWTSSEPQVGKYDKPYKLFTYLRKPRTTSTEPERNLKRKTALNLYVCSSFEEI